MLKANAAYAVGSVANSAALVLLVPYLVNRWSAGTYGLWSLLEIALLLANMLALCGADVGLMREYWNDEALERRRTLAGSVLLFVAGWGAALCVLAALAGCALRWVWPVPGFDDRLLQAGMLVLATAVFEALFALLLTLFRIREQPERYVVLSSGRMLLFVAAVWFVVEHGGGVRAALLARLGASGIAAVCAAVMTREQVRLVLDRSALGRVVRYGLPLLPANLAAYVLLASDRYFLQYFTSLEVVACYAFAYKIASVVDALITRPFALDWAPRRFRIAAEPESNTRYSAALVLYGFAMSTGMLCVLTVTPVVYRWLAPAAYARGQALVPLLLAAYAVAGLAVPLNVGIMLRDQTRRLPQIQWLAAVVCTGLNVWLIPRFELWGAGWATFVAYLVSTCSVAWLSLRLYPIRYDGSALAAVGCMLIAGVLGLHAIDHALGAVGFWSIASGMVWVVVLAAAVGRMLWIRGRRATAA